MKSIIKKLLIEPNEIRLNESYVRIRSGESKTLYLFLKSIIRYIFTFRKIIKSNLAYRKSEVCFFTSTKNQDHSTHELKNMFTDYVHIKSDDNSCQFYYPWVVTVVVSFLFFPVSFLFYFFYFGFGKIRLLSYSLDEFIRTPGYIASSCLILIRVKPKFLIMSNDHNTINRALCVVSKFMGLKTIYIQHSPVNDLFPRMIFDYAFVDGLESEKIYRASGASEVTYIKLGALRYASIYGLKKIERSVESVLICVNKLDKLEVLGKYINELEAAGIHYKIRLHPAMKEHGFYNIELRPLEICLSEYKYVLAGDSGVILDSVVSGSISLYAKDMSMGSDIYGYVRNNVAESIDYKSIVSLIMEGNLCAHSQLENCEIYDSSCQILDSVELFNKYKAEFDNLLGGK
ncbi:hypothetical protein OH458_17530 [Vibrio sp. MarTm2]|uniref:hypothetical protein n=1 Tax=Vibrio sp. MarTm2 TaxID=2998831 RepID=UPI0022CD79C6|nr:hypothetical protein [Vibrio sp. MarTm2]MDA0129876.1 hypothetical protein [Vibrio sp. MarTm2]